MRGCKKVRLSYNPAVLFAARDNAQSGRIRISRPPRVFSRGGFYYLSGLGLRRFYGADVRAGSAVDAFIGVDNVLAVAFRNSAAGAFLGTGSAGDAVIRNFVNQLYTPPSCK